MPYQVSITNRAAKELRKIPPHISELLVRETLKLADDPYLGLQLRGKLRDFRSLHLKLQNVQYRVVYKVIENIGEISIYALGTRENFYRELERINLKKAA